MTHPEPSKRRRREQPEIELQRARTHGRALSHGLAEGAQGRLEPRMSDPGRLSPEAVQTVRQRIAEVLRSEQLTAHEISQRASVSERDVAEHLRHLEHTLRQTAEKLHTVAPHCIKCSFTFGADMHRRPSRCPRCKSERLSPPRFHIGP